MFNFKEDPELSPKRKAESTEPWWNDGSKVAGLCATIVLVALACLVAALIFKLIFWIF